MKSKLVLLFGLAIALALSACATATFSTGRDFDTSKVAQIEKSKTTAAELVTWFGPTTQKSVATDGSEVWTWFFTQSKSHAQSYIISMDVKTQTAGKKLAATLRDGIVQTYSFSEGPMAVVP